MSNTVRFDSAKEAFIKLYGSKYNLKGFIKPQEIEEEMLEAIRLRDERIKQLNKKLF